MRMQLTVGRASMGSQARPGALSRSQLVGARVREDAAFRRSADANAGLQAAANQPAVSQSLQCCRCRQVRRKAEGGDREG